MYSVVLMAALTAGSATPDCHRCGGCCGCYGGWGGCYGGWGGCYGGWGGCYGGCWGGWGGCYGGCYGGFGGCYGCWGGYASWGVTAGAPVVPGAYDGMMAPTGPSGEPLPPGKTDKDKKDKEKDKSSMLSPNKAKLVVDLPANAKLFIDDMPMKSFTGVRSFNTPALEAGQSYYYMVRVETIRDGKPVSETRRVIVRAGQIARADFTDVTSETVRTAQAK